MNIQRVNYNVLMVSLIKTDVAQTKASKALVRSKLRIGCALGGASVQMFCPRRELIPGLFFNFYLKNER
jgi:hypothetical protein